MQCHLFLKLLVSLYRYKWTDSMAVNLRFFKIEIASEKHRIGLGVHLKVFVHHNKQSQHKFTIREQFCTETTISREILPGKMKKCSKVGGDKGRHLYISRSSHYNKLKESEECETHHRIALPFPLLLWRHEQTSPFYSVMGSIFRLYLAVSMSFSTHKLSVCLLSFVREFDS